MVENKIKKNQRTRTRPLKRSEDGRKMKLVALRYEGNNMHRCTTAAAMAASIAT